MNFRLKLRPKDENWSPILRPYVSDGVKWRPKFGSVSKFRDYFEAQSLLETKSNIGFRKRVQFLETKNIWSLNLRPHQNLRSLSCDQLSKFGLQNFRAHVGPL